MTCLSLWFGTFEADASEPNCATLINANDSSAKVEVDSVISEKLPVLVQCKSKPQFVRVTSSDGKVFERWLPGREAFDTAADSHLNVVFSGHGESSARVAVKPTVMTMGGREDESETLKYQKEIHQELVKIRGLLEVLASGASGRVNGPYVLKKKTVIEKRTIIESGPELGDLDFAGLKELTAKVNGEVIPPQEFVEVTPRASEVATSPVIIRPPVTEPVVAEPVIAMPIASPSAPAPSPAPIEMIVPPPSVASAVSVAPTPVPVVTVAPVESSEPPVAIAGTHVEAAVVVADEKTSESQEPPDRGSEIVTTEKVLSPVIREIASVPAGTGGIFVQLHSLGPTTYRRDIVLGEFEKLNFAEAGLIPSFCVWQSQRTLRRWMRVVLGPFKDRAEANKVWKRVGSKSFVTVIDKCESWNVQ
ncbi:MAG: hypothetical protein NDI61_12855 [Bdellovibrionaceae bacterium]|nr:hypothetical protein [Pseudobdellovibrionaceae bacterium]